MKVLGKGGVHFYEAEDECPHAPGDEELWQESFVIYMWDTEQDVYVFLRLAQIPNSRGGRSSVWLNAWTPEHMYHHTDDSRPYDPADRTETSLASGELCRYEYVDGDHHWTVNDSDHDVRINLVQKDFHQGLGYHQGDALVKQVSTLHIEATGEVTGTVSVKGKSYQVKGIGWRDHGMGYRDWLSIRVHRFYPALFGPEFSAFLVTFVGIDGKLLKVGTIIQDDTVQFTDDFEITAFMGNDGVSNAGGLVHLTVDGDMRELRFDPVGKSSVNMQDGFPCVDGMCIVTMGEKKGVGVSETSNRAQMGDQRPAVFDSSPGVIENGVYPR